ncbi:MAG: type II 3-dehydroquinate dehydratase [Actinomycetota bacterium]
MKIAVIHGPNLNLLGSRELAVYGSMTLAEVNSAIEQEAARMEMELSIHQASGEGAIIDLLHAGVGDVAGAILNPAAYSHTSRAIADAIRAVPYPVVEVHLSNIHAREPWRHVSVTAEAARGIVAGFGVASYVMGLHALKGMVSS